MSSRPPSPSPESSIEMHLASLSRMPNDLELLHLRPLRTSDEAVFLSAHAQLAAEGHPFGITYQPGMRWDDFLRHVSDQAIGRGLPEGFVANTFLLAELDGVVVGRTSIRHELNDFLTNFGGHIGYSVIPEHRRKGYATEILRQSVILARAMGIDRVLVTADDSNVGSIRTIENNGGVLENVVTMPNVGPRRRYRI